MPDVDDTSTSNAGEPRAAADLGILLVHGIGEQAQGETLTKFAEPIVDWIRDFLFRESPQGSLVASVPIDAALRPPLLAPDIPAHARVAIGSGSADAAVQEWLFAEAWWSPQVLTPPIGAFTAWLVTRGPWLLLFHFNQHSWLASPEVSNWWKWLIGVPLSLVWMVLSLVLSTVLVAASLIAVIPIGRVRRAVYAVLRQIAGVLGDAYVQLRSPIQRVAFERATLEAMKWLRPRCRRLAVVAHSQGAAIAHRALRGGAPQADLLVTVGAGITKLEALRYLERLGPSDRIAACLAPPILLAAVIVTLRTRALGLDDVASRNLLPGTLALVGLALLGAIWITVRRALRTLRESEHMSLAVAQPDLQWVDIVATHDPVPFGALSRFFTLRRKTKGEHGEETEEDEIESHEIPILRSRLADHTSYWTARASFMQVLVPRLARHAGLRQFMETDAGALERLSAADRIQWRDLRALSIARLLDFFAFVVPFGWARDRLLTTVEHLRVLLAGKSAPGTTATQAAPLKFIEDAINNVELGLRWTADVVGGDAGTWARPVVNLAVAALFIALVLLAWQRLEFAVWQAWTASRNERALRGKMSLAGIPEERVPQTIMYSALSKALANTAMVATLLLAITVSVAWSGMPEWANERGVYWLFGQVAAGLFAVLMLLSVIADNAPAFVRVRKFWRRWRDRPADGDGPRTDRRGEEVR